MRELTLFSFNYSSQVNKAGDALQFSRQTGDALQFSRQTGDSPQFSNQAGNSPRFSDQTLDDHLLLNLIDIP